MKYVGASQVTGRFRGNSPVLRRYRGPNLIWESGGSAPTVITQASAPVLAVPAAGDTARSAYDNGTPGAYTVGGDLTVSITSVKMRVGGEVVADGYILAAEDVLDAVETATASDGFSKGFASASVTVGVGDIAFAASSPQTISLSATESGSTFGLDEWFTGGSYPYSYAIQSDDTPATTLDGTSITIGGTEFSGTVIVRGTDAEGATADLTINVAVAAAALRWTGPLPTTYITEGETVSIDLAPYLEGTPAGEVIAVAGLPDGLSVNQAGPSIDGAAILDYVAPTQSDFTYFAEHPTQPGKVQLTLRDGYTVPADHEVRFYFGENETADPADLTLWGTITPGETYNSNGTWASGTLLYRATYLRRISDGAAVDVRQLGSFVIATPADTTAPTLTGATANPNGETAGTAYVTPDESCTIFARVRLASGSVADAATVQAEGQSGGGSSGIAANFVFSGLTTGTAYAVDFMAVDGSGNVSDVVSSGSFTPAAVPAGSITINDFSRDYSIFGSAPQLGRSYAEVPLSGTGTPGQVIEAKTSDGAGSALFSSTREAVLALFDRTNPNGVQISKSLLASPSTLPAGGGVTIDVGQKKVRVSSGATLTAQNIDFDGWIIDVYGTLVTDNCIIGNPTTALRSTSAPWFLRCWPGSRWDATYTSILSRGTREDASLQLVRIDYAITDPNVMPITNIYRCRFGGTGSDIIKPSRGRVAWCYFDAPMISDAYSSIVHADTITVQQVHPTEGLVVEACLISNNGRIRPSDMPFAEDSILNAGTDADRNNIIRMDYITAERAQDSTVPFGRLIVRDSVFRPDNEAPGRPFQIVEPNTLSFQAPEFVRNQYLSFNSTGDYWYEQDDEDVVRWDQNVGPSGETLPKPTTPSIDITAGPAPSIDSWDDPALGASGESWFTVATVDGSGEWSGICQYPRKAGWYLPTVRVQGGDGTEVSSSTRCGAGFDLAIHGQSNCSYPWAENYDDTGRPMAPPLPVANPNILQIAVIRRNTGDSPQPAKLVRVSDATPYSAGACMLSNAINELTGGIPTMVRAHPVAGRGLNQQVDMTTSSDKATNWVDEQAIHYLASADGSQVDGHFHYLEGGTNVGAYYWDDFIAAALFGKRANGDTFTAPGTAGNEYMTNTLREFYDPDHTKFGWFSREADHADKFRDAKSNPNLAPFFLEHDEGFSPNRSWARGFFHDSTTLRDTNHSSLNFYDGAPRLMGMMGLNMLQMIGGLSSKTAIIDRIKLHPDGNAKAVALGSTAGPLTTLRRSIGYMPVNTDNDNLPPRSKTRLGDQADAYGFVLSGSAIDETEIRNDAGELADEGWIWLYKNNGADWTESDLANIGYVTGSFGWPRPIPDAYERGYDWADIPGLATGESNVGAITIQDRLPDDLGTNPAYRV